MEKADILEMTVKHLKRLQESIKTLEKNNPSSRSYSLGFDECTQEVSEFFRPSSPFTSELKLNLLNHLRKCAPHNLPDSPSSSPSKTSTAPLKSSISNSASSTITNTDVNSDTESTSKTVFVSIADSILSRCLLSTFPSTSSNIITSYLNINSNSSLVGPNNNSMTSEERKNVSTPVAVSSTSDDTPIEPHMIVEEPVLERDVWRNRERIWEERSPSPSQIASSRILSFFRSSKVHRKTLHASPSSANTVKRDLLNAFEGEIKSKNNMNALQNATDPENSYNGSFIQSNYSEECEQSRNLLTCCKNNRSSSSVYDQLIKHNESYFETGTHSNNDNFNSQTNILSTTCGSITDLSQLHVKEKNNIPIANGTIEFNPVKEMIIGNANTTDSNKFVTSNRGMTLLPMTPNKSNSLIFSKSSSQRPIENNLTYLIPIFIESDDNTNNLHASVMKNPSAILPGNMAETQSNQQKEKTMVKDDNSQHLPQISPSTDINQQRATDHTPVITHTNSEDTSILFKDEKKSATPKLTCDSIETSTSFKQTQPYDNSMSKTSYKICNGMKSASECVDDYDDNEVKSKTFSLRVKKTPLALRIDDSGSCCNSDDECHESGHITSDSSRSSSGSKEWVWGYSYGSDEDDDEMSGPTIVKRIKPTIHSPESSSTDTSSGSKSRRNSFSKRIGEFRLRKGSLSQRMNMYKLSRDPLDTRLSLAGQIVNVSQRYKSTEILNQSDDDAETITNNKFRKRCFTYSHRPSRPLIASNSKALTETNTLGNNPNTALTILKDEKGTSLNTNENVLDTPRSRGNSNGREFLTARRRYATVSAKDLLGKRPILPKTFIESSGGEESIPEDKRVSSINLRCNNHVKCFVSNRNVDGAEKFRKRCSTISSSRISNAAQELNWTRPSELLPKTTNDICGTVVLSQNRQHSNTVVETDRRAQDKTDHDNESYNNNLNPPLKIVKDFALSELESTRETVLRSNSNYLIASSAPSDRSLFIDPFIDSDQCSKMLNQSSKASEYVVPSCYASNVNMNNETMQIINKTMTKPIDCNKSFLNNNMPTMPKYNFNQEPTNKYSCLQDSSPLNLSTKLLRRSVQYLPDSLTGREFAYLNTTDSSIINENEDQRPSTVTMPFWGDQVEPYRSRSSSVSTGMSSLSLTGPSNRTGLLSSNDDEDENVWRPW